MVTNDVYRVMAIDALASSHPLSFPEDEIQTPAQISEVFDAIAYSKVRVKGGRGFRPPPPHFQAQRTNVTPSTC